MLPGRVYADSGTISFPDFSDPTGLTLNLDAKTAPNLNNDGTALRLVPDAYDQHGQGYLNCAIGMGDTTSFHSKFRFRIHGSQGPDGADGLAFVLHNDPAGAYAAGDGGPSLGYRPTSPSVAIELDTYPYNSGDPWGQKHVALLTNGNVENPLTYAVPSDIVLNDGNAHWLWVDYNGTTNELQVFLGDDEANKPAVPLFSYVIDIPSTLGTGGQAFFGFTAATGGSWNNHDIESWVLDITDSSGPIQKCAAVPPVPNDEAATATAMEPLSFLQPFLRSMSTRNATGTGTEAGGACAGSLHTVWYRYTAPDNDQLRVSIFSSYLTNLAVFTGTPGALTQTACNPLNGSFPVEKDKTYYLMIGEQLGFWDGYGYLQVAAELLPPPPSNDNASSAKVVGSLPFTDDVDTTYATPAPDDPPCPNLYSVWYQFTPTRDMTILADSHNWYKTISVSVGSPGSLTHLLCGGTQVKFDAKAGTTYYMMVGDYGYGGFLHFTMEEVVPPVNDNITNATLIGKLPFTDSINTTYATTAADDPGCPNGYSVWYRYTPATSGRIAVSTSGTDYNGYISVFAGSPGALTNIVCGGWNNVGFEASAGNTYYLMVGTYNWGENGGNLKLSVQEGLRLGVTFNPTGSVKRLSGLATISGTVTCNQRSSISNLFGMLFQRAGRFTVISGNFYVQYPNDQSPNPQQCEPSKPLQWSVEVAGNGPFNSGQAEARAGAYGCSLEVPDCASMPQQVRAVVQLKPTK